MKFSIITPSYNQGKYIEDCIESVLVQKEVEYEHIIIDACSSDETITILKNYPHLIWISEPDKGQTDAINKGFKKASGDYLIWLNADDYFMPGALKKVEKFIKVKSFPEIVYGDCFFVDENKQLIREKKEFEFDLFMLLLYGCYIPSTAAFYNYKIIKDGFFLDDTYKVVMDFEYYVRLACNGYNFIYMGFPVASFRWHNNNVSLVNDKKRYQERLQVQRWGLNQLRLNFLGNEFLLRLLFYFYKIKRLFMRMFRIFNK